MKLRKVIAIGVCTAMVLQSMGMVSMAEIKEKVGLENVISSVASPSDAEKVEGNVNDEVYAPSQENGDIANSRKLEATPSDAIYVNSEEDLRQAVKKSGMIILEGEIPLTQTLAIEGNVAVELVGGNVTFAGDESMRHMLLILGGAEVTLNDFALDATGINYKGGNDYYAIFVERGLSKLKITGSTSITYDTANGRQGGLRGIGIYGSCQIDSGHVSGFGNGISVGRGGNAVINDIDISDCDRGIAVVGKADDGQDGVLYLNGGTISGSGGKSGSSTGILNRGQVYMKGGTITEFFVGILNSNEAALDKAKFTPVLEMSGGEIYGNWDSAIINEKRGTVTIKGDADISGNISRERQIRAFSTNGADTKKVVIENTNHATLKMEDGTITAAATGEIAVSNDENSKFEMTGGTIEAVGEQSYAIQNKNKDVGAVAIKGGNISAKGNGSQIFDDQGYMQVSKDVEVNQNGTDKFWVSVDFNEGGTVTPGAKMVAKDQIIEFIVTPDTGYKIESVMFDGVSQPQSPYKLDVAGKSHFVEVTFIKVSSGNNSSGGGSGSGGSSSGRSVAKTAVSVIPETPGSWLQTEAGWQYLNADGIAYANTWIYKAGKWYWIESNGFMAEGWKQINNQWYYLMPTSGEMKTGWIIVDGKWYFLGTDGKMASNTTTPDGYQVDASGAWIQ